jgi:hypothetical protein
LWLYGCRAAFRSLNAWASGGLTGSSEGKPMVESWSDLLNECLQDATSEQRDGDRSTRWQVSRWVYQIAFVRFRVQLRAQGKTGNALREAVKAARRRLRVMVSIIWGASLADACTLAGFESSKAFANSARAAGLFDALRQARAECQTERMELARIGRRRFGLEAAQAAKAMRSLGVIRGAFTNTQRAHSLRGQRDIQKTILWRRVAQRRGRAVELAKFWSGVMVAEMNANDKAWQRVSRGLSSGQFNDLRRVVGLIDKRGHLRRL